jgi:hypothetical protein
MSETKMSSSQIIEKALLEGDRDAYDREAQHRFRSGMAVFGSFLVVVCTALAAIVVALSRAS